LAKRKRQEELLLKKETNKDEDSVDTSFDHTSSGMNAKGKRLKRVHDHAEIKIEEELSVKGMSTTK
jgi:hypothetical protein